MAFALIFMLAALLLHRDHDAGGQVRNAHGGFGFVDMLAAGAGGAIDIDAQIAFVDLHVDFLDFRQDRDRYGAGVDAALGFRGGDALHAVHAGFEFEFGEDGFAGDFGDTFLQAAELGFAIFHDLRIYSRAGRSIFGRPGKVPRRRGRLRRRRRRGGFPESPSGRPFRLSAEGRGGCENSSSGICCFRDSSSASAKNFISGSARRASASALGALCGAQLGDAGFYRFEFGKLLGGFDKGFAVEVAGEHETQFFRAGEDAVKFLV